MNHLSYLEINEITKKDLQFQMQYHPFVVLKYWVINIKNNATGGSIILPSLSDLQNQKGGNNMLYGLSQIQNILMVILSLILPIYFLLRRRKLDYFIIATSFLIWYILLTSGISYFQGDRFHLVFYPLVLMQVAFILFKKKATNIA